MSLTCEKCGTENPDNVKFCKQCGSKLVEETAVSTPTPPVSSPPVKSAPAWQPAAPAPAIMERRYGTLRSISAICRIIGYLSVVLIILFGIIGALTVTGLSDSLSAAVGAFVGTVISAFLVLVFWLIIAESISVILDIEENTRKAAVFLQQREV